MTNTLTPNYLYQHYPNIPTSLTSLVSGHTSDALPSKLIHLVRLLASQINDCEFCQNMHIKEALKDGDTQQRIDALPTWESCLLFTELEKQALLWTKTLTLLHESKNMADEYKDTLEAFGERRFMALTSVILQINSWNRIAKGLGF
ncbi:MAG: carboxymuconolactone decarboxylase family protein [Pseudomonadota bacterium]|nr:carboxymuconolactone decarboxylase family protein [Pseudomonadota bacterium]